MAANESTATAWAFAAWFFGILVGIALFGPSDGAVWGILIGFVLAIIAWHVEINGGGGRDSSRDDHIQRPPDDYGDFGDN